jgi:putative phosphoesterase
MKRRSLQTPKAKDADRPAGSLVGLISDTHGLLRPEALAALAGVDLIIHAGDVGGPEILDRLREIAAVVAVRGNVDTEPWTEVLRTTAVAEAGSALIYVLHNLREMDLDPAAAGFHIVVSGHTHKPLRFARDGVLYINPGSAGPRRFSLPISAARIDLRATPWEIDFLDLSGA